MLRQGGDNGVTTLLSQDEWRARLLAELRPVFTQLSDYEIITWVKAKMDLDFGVANSISHFRRLDTRLLRFLAYGKNDIFINLPVQEATCLQVGRLRSALVLSPLQRS